MHEKKQMKKTIEIIKADKEKTDRLLKERDFEIKYLRDLIEEAKREGDHVYADYIGVEEPDKPSPKSSDDSLTELHMSPIRKTSSMSKRQRKKMRTMTMVDGSPSIQLQTSCKRHKVSY